MAKIKIYNNGYITNETDVNIFIERIEDLINTLKCHDIDTEEVEKCKEGVTRSRCYGQRDIWFIKNTEEYLEKVDDLPF